jgi:hypothetical protein
MLGFNSAGKNVGEIAHLQNILQPERRSPASCDAGLHLIA